MPRGRTGSSAAWRWALLPTVSATVGGTLLALINALTVRPTVADCGSTSQPDSPGERVAICIPARDEADTLPGLLDDLRRQRGPHRLRIIVVDDGSTDATAAIARERTAADERFRVLAAPAGSAGKTAACRVAADSTNDFAPEVLIFLDADVRVSASAIVGAVAELRRSRAALLSVWPVQHAVEPLGALLQPLLAWSWSTTMPLRWSEARGWPSMAVACGQFLVFDAAEYRRIGGHAAVGTAIAEDLAIARAMRRAGGRTIVRYAPDLARCTMYRSAAAVRTGHRRWLYPSTGGSIAAMVTVAHLATIAAAPALLLAGDRSVRAAGAIAWSAAVAGRLLVRRAETGTRLTPADVGSAVAHPVATAIEAALVVQSAHAHRFGDVQWKGRRLNR